MHAFPFEPEHDADTEGWVDDAALADLLTPEQNGASRPQSVVLPARSELRRVVIRMDADEDVVVAHVEGRDEAVKTAREWIATIEAAVISGDWPAVGERFLRPGAILSVDVERAD